MSADDKLNILKDMIALIGEAVLDAERRAQFQTLVARFDEVASKPKRVSKRTSKSSYSGVVPDIHAEFASRSREDFLAWVSTFDLPLLKHIVKVEQFDPSSRSRSWRKSEKFADLIVEQLDSRATRGLGIGRVVSGS
jgi:hypothetical protein